MIHSNIFRKKKLLLALACAVIGLNAQASEGGIQRDGWSYDRQGFRASPEKIAEVKLAGKGISLPGWAEYDVEIPKSGWYSLWLGGSPDGWSRDVFVDGKTITRLQTSLPEDEVQPMPKKGVQYKEANLFLTAGKHTLRLQRYGFPGVLPAVWELRPSEGKPGDSLRASVEGSRIGAAGSTIAVKFLGGASEPTFYELLWRNELTRESLPAGKIEFAATAEPGEQTLNLTLPADGLYSLMAKSGGEWLRPSDVKAGYFLVAPPAPAAKKSAESGLQFAGIFQNGVILQRQKPLPVWGWSKPGDEVTISLSGQTEKAVSDSSGRWQVTFKAVEAGPLGELKAAAGGREIVCRDVCAGEVWLLSGQSNMGGPLLGSTGGLDAARSANFPDVRLAFLFGAQTGDDTWRLNSAWWMPAVANGNPENLKKWTGIAFAFGTKINEDLKVPVGLINANRGGTYLTTWASIRTHEQEPSLKALRDSYLRDDAERIPERAYLNKLAEGLAKWRNESAKAKAEGKPDPAAPVFPATVPLANYPAQNYESLIEPLAPFAIRGVLWYQGESDSGMAAAYRQRFPALIQNWRDLWKNPDMPFLFVQIAYGSGNRFQGEPGDNAGGELKEAQQLALKVPHTAMVVTDDLMKPGDDVHYPDKLPVGNRLALAALATVYGRDVEASGPIYLRHKIEGGKIRLFFDHASGLAAKDGKPGGFAIAGADRKWVWADAEIDGKTVLVTSAKVPTPMAVRYSWADSPCGGNLVNQAGLPSSVFRTDDWPMVTEGVLLDQKN